MKKLISLLMLSLVLILAACGSDATDKPKESSDTKPETETPEKEVESENLKVGDSATIDDITVTVTKAEVTDERNEFDDVNPERAVIVDFVVENKTDSDYPVGMDFNFYVDGKKVDTLAIGNVTMDSLAPGRTIEGQVAYPADGEVLELEFKPALHFGNERYIYDIEL